MSFTKPSYEKHLKNEAIAFKQSLLEYHTKIKGSPTLVCEPKPNNFTCEICNLTLSFASRYKHTRSKAHYKRLYNINDQGKPYTYYGDLEEKSEANKTTCKDYYQKNKEVRKKKCLENYYKRKASREEEENKKNSDNENDVQVTTIVSASEASSSES